MKEINEVKKLLQKESKKGKIEIPIFNEIDKLLIQFNDENIDFLNSQEFSKELRELNGLIFKNITHFLNHINDLENRWGDMTQEFRSSHFGYNIYQLIIEKKRKIKKMRKLI